MLVLIVKKNVRNKSSYFGSCKYTKSFDDLILERDELIWWFDIRERWINNW